MPSVETVYYELQYFASRCQPEHNKNNYMDDLSMFHLAHGSAPGPADSGSIHCTSSTSSPIDAAGPVCSETLSPEKLGLPSVQPAPHP